MTDLNFKCIVPDCPRSATSKSATCVVHLTMETIIFAVAAASILWLIIYAASGPIK